MTELEAVQGWLSRMQALTGASPQSLLSFSPEKNTKERCVLLALCVQSCMLSIQYGSPEEFARKLARGELDK